MFFLKENMSCKKVVSCVATTIALCTIAGIEGYKIGLLCGLLLGPSIAVAFLAVVLALSASYSIISELSADEIGDKIIPVLAICLSSISVGLIVGCITGFSIPLLSATGAVTIGLSLITAAFEFGLMDKFTNSIVEKIQKKDVNVQPGSKMEEVQDSQNLGNTVKV